MALSQVQFLLMLAEDARFKGDTISDEVRKTCLAHAKEIMELSELIDRAKEIIEIEKTRFAQYMPTNKPTEHLNQTTPPRIMRKVASNESQS